MKVVLIRHSKTVFEPDIPNVNWVLSDEGVKLAEELAKNDIFKGIEVLYSSLQNKALETAVILAKPNHIPIKTDNKLTELTSVTNKFIPDFEKAIHDLYGGEVLRINLGETLEEGLLRFDKAIWSIVKHEEDKSCVGVVAHGNVLSLFAAKYCSFKAYDIHKRIQMPDYAIFDTDSKLFLKFFGDD